MQITVTQADIDAGVKCDSDRCPIALAAMRTLGEGIVTVSQYDLFFHDLSGRIKKSWLPSDAAARFITYFDTDRPVKPATFEFTAR